MPTVARGVAAAALLASLWVGVLAVQGHWPVPPEPPPVWCASPIEVSTADGRGRLACADAAALRTCQGRQGRGRLACADAAALQACQGLQAGDRVELDAAVQPPQCRVQPQGMRAGWRLLRGLPIDLNCASAQELQLLEGIGPKTAANIVAYRHRVGRVRDLEELRRVRGIGPKTVAQLRGLLSADLGGPVPSARPGGAVPEGCAALPRQSIGERCNVDG